MTFPRMKREFREINSTVLAHFIYLNKDGTVSNIKAAQVINYNHDVRDKGIESVPRIWNE